MQQHRQQYRLRESQQRAIDKTITYFKNVQTNQNVFLWNAVMRWGKCLTSLNFVDQWNQQNKNKIKNVLILTFFPQTEDSWARLLSSGVEEQSNFSKWNYINVDSRNQNPQPNTVNVFFASFQELYTGKQRKEFLFKQDYDIVILDEYHHGAYNTRAKNSMKQLKEVSFDSFDENVSKEDYKNSEDLINRLNYRFKLVLSGTPYKTFSIDGFNKTNTFTFTYFDEQRDRLKNGINSDYRFNPAINLYSIRLQDDKLEERVKFILQNKLIFSRNAQKSFFLNNPNPSSFWLIPSVKDANIIEKYIKSFDINNEYNVINLYSKRYADGSRTLELVREDITSSNKINIILSFNKLTLGVTIPEIENVVFLREITTPELYMQAASRSKSQYSGDLIKKDSVPLISFDRTVDFNIFSNITNTRQSREDENITEGEFLKLLPIYFIDYNDEYNDYIITECDETQSFLNALANVSIDEIIRKSVSPYLEKITDIPVELLEELNNIAEIGMGKSVIKVEDAEYKEILPKTPEKIAERAGFSQGKSDKLHNQSNSSDVPEKYKKYSEEFKVGYEKGFAYEKKTVEPDEKDEKLSGIRRKIELLIRRFIYVMIATYFVEGRFIDIEDAPEDFFTSLLGFRKESFLRLHGLYILNNDYIDSVINNFRSIENNNTNYVGLSKHSDYEFVISSDEVVLEAKKDSLLLDIDALKSAVKEMKNFEEKDTTKDSKSQKYIYIAKPSKWIIGLKDAITQLLKEDLKLKQLKEILQGYYLFINDLTRGVKIGETHRLPTERLEELNGYTRKINDSYILFDLFDSVKVPDDVTDTQFHNYLEKKNYERVKDDIRREIFDITGEKAKEELELFLYELNNKDKTLVTFTELEKVNTQLIDKNSNPTYIIKYNNNKELSGTISELYKEILTWYYEKNRKDFFRVIMKKEEFGFDPAGGNYNIKISDNVYVHNYPANKPRIFELLNLFIQNIEEEIKIEIKKKDSEGLFKVNNNIKSYIQNKDNS